MGEIIYDCRWSDQLDNKFIKDFIDTENAVFSGNYTLDFFRKKYVDNIYGKSVVVVVYMDNVPVAARGLWRNDIYGKPAYQPVDTCVTEACRGKGIFIEMTNRSLGMLKDNDIVYNFPNQNSFPGYMKMGWKLVKEYGVAFFISAKGYLKEHPVKMDKRYADWWLNENTQKMWVFRTGKEYFLVRKKFRFCYEIFACIEKDIADRFKRKPFGICFYRSEKKTFYNKKIGKPIRVVSKNSIEYIPTWKIDAI